MGTLRGRVRRVERTLKQTVNQADASHALERIERMRVTRDDLERIARGEWEHVQDTDLRASNPKHRERWERATPAVLMMFNLE